MGFPCYLLELRWSPLCEYSYLFTTFYLLTLYLTVLHLLRRLHGLPRSLKVRILDPHLCPAIRYPLDSLLHVRSLLTSFPC